MLAFSRTLDCVTVAVAVAIAVAIALAPRLSTFHLIQTPTS